MHRWLMHLLSLQNAFPIISYLILTAVEGWVGQVSWFLLFSLILLCPTACRILIPDQGWNPRPLHGSAESIHWSPREVTTTPVLQMELLTFTKVRRLVHGWKTKLGFDVDLASVHFPQHPTAPAHESHFFTSLDYCSHRSINVAWCIQPLIFTLYMYLFYLPIYLAKRVYISKV